MDDETLFHEQQYAPETPPNDVDWLAVLLELLPFSAILFFFAFVLDSDAGNWVAFILLMAQGLGWLKIGRVGTGCMIGFARAIALWAVTIVSLISGIELLFCAWGGPDADNSDCNEGTLGVVFLTSLIALFITAFLVPIISAIMVGRASTRRAEWD